MRAAATAAAALANSATAPCAAARGPVSLSSVSRARRQLLRNPSKLICVWPRCRIASNTSRHVCIGTRRSGGTLHTSPSPIGSASRGPTTSPDASAPRASMAHLPFISELTVSMLDSAFLEDHPDRPLGTLDHPLRFYDNTRTLRLL